MDYSFFQQQTSSYPSVYKIQLYHPNELLTLYSSVILANTPVCKVESELADYVTSGIEPTGWKAIWRASPRISGLSFKCDFLVNVVDVIRNQLDAVIVIEQPLSVQLNELPDDNAERMEIDKLIKEQRIINAPIYELYIINEDDKDEFFLKSAAIIENVRFFMKFIWRAWDTIANETQLNEIFVETRLESRLNLYFDIQNCLLSQAQIKRIKQILTDSWKLRNQLDDIIKKQDVDKDPNDEYEIDEMDISEAIRLKIKLEDYDREMRMLEDPYLRPFTFLLKVDLDEENKRLMIESNSTTGTESNDQDELIEEKKPIIHVVSKAINLNSLQLINSYYAEDEQYSQAEIVFHQNLKDAIKSSKNDDRIAILPGHYIYESVPWIENDLQIEGLTTNEDDVIIESSAFVDVFIHCPNNLTLKNLTLKCPNRDLVINGDFESFRGVKKFKKSSS